MTVSRYAKNLPQSFVDGYRGRTVPWGPVGYITYKRTYARRVDEGNTEEWWQTCQRCVNGLLALGAALTKDEACNLYDHWFHLRVSTGGRGLWQLGTPTVERIGADSLQNCWHVAVDNQHGPSRPFTFTFNQLMLGGGVGFNINPEYVYELPTVANLPDIQRVEQNDCDFIVPDNREGWVDLVRRVIDAFFDPQIQRIHYNTGSIRPKGRLIASFGGTASGSEILVHGVEHLARVIGARLGKKLRAIDCLDMMNIIGSVVVAGNVRRSAQIAIGSPTDPDFLDAKNWGKGAIPDWRRMSNNTIQANRYGALSRAFWETYEGNSEPYGLFNPTLSCACGRLQDKHRSDPNVVGLNPCGEITLPSYGACNLLEIFLPNLQGPKQLAEVAGLAVKIGKTISAVPFLDPVAQEIKERDRRLGIGVTGYLQPSKGLGRRFKPEELGKVYPWMEEVDEEYSRKLGINSSIKLTCVKPSGTLSLLAGCTPGAHPAYARHYIRRIRFSADDPLVGKCREHGYHVEPQLSLEGRPDPSIMIVSFPCEAPQGTTLAEDMSAVDQLEVQRELQTHWSDNSVSMTCYYRPEELPIVKDYLAMHYEQDIKSCSFLLHTGHGFMQAPMEAVSKEQYTELLSGVKPINEFDERDDHAIDTIECAGGACPVK